MNPAQDSITTEFENESQKLTLSGAARVLGISPTSLRRHTALGKIQAKRLDNGYRLFDIQEVNRFKKQLKAEHDEYRRRLGEEVRKNHTEDEPIKKTFEKLGVATKKKKSLTRVLAGSLAGVLIFTVVSSLALNSSFTGAGVRRYVKLADNWVRDSLGVKTLASRYDNVSTNVLSAADRNANWVFNINGLAFFKDIVTAQSDVNVLGNLNVSNLSTLAGGVITNTLSFNGVGSINNLLAIDTVTKTTLESGLDLAGDVESTGLGDTVVVALNGEPLGDTTAEEENILMAVGGEWVSTPTTEIASLGVISTGTWEADPIGTSFGGTGLSSYVIGDLIYATAPGTLAQLPIGSGGYVLSSNGTNPSWQPISSFNLNAWLLNGNTGTSQETNFIGTTDTQGLTFRTNNIERLFVSSSGLTGIGTTNPTQLLDVAGAIRLGGVGTYNILNTAIAGGTAASDLFWGNYTLVDSNNVSSYATTGVTAGTGLAGGGTVGALAVNVGAGNGITVNADDITLDTTTLGTSSTTAANSGLEVTADGLRIIGGCSDGQQLNWDASRQVWECSSDGISGSGAAGLVTFWTAPNVLSSSQDFYWDNVSTNLGLGTTTPSQELDVQGGIRLGAASLNNVLNTSAGPGVPTGDLYWGTRILTDNTNVSNYATTAVTAGSGLTGGGTVGTLTVNVGAGNGIVVNANDITIDSTTTGVTSVTASNSGIEVGTEGLRLIGGCSDGQQLNWDATLQTWKCATSGGGTVTGNGSLGQAAFWTNASTLSGNDNFFWDNSLSRLGIGTTAPNFTLEVNGDASFTAATLGQLNINGDSFSDLTGDGLAVSSNTLTIDATTTATTSTTASNSGLEVGADGLRIIGGCAGSDVLSWNSTLQTWGCSSIAGTGAVTGNGTAGQATFWTNSTTISGTDNFFWDNSAGRLGIGTSAPAYTLDVNGDTRVASGSDFYKGTIGLGSTGPTNITSGASVIGAFDEFTYAATGTVQSVLKDFDNRFITDSTNITNLIGSTHPAVSLNAGSTNYLSLNGSTQVLSAGAIDLSTVANTSGLLGTLKGGTGIDGSSSPAGTLLIGTGSGFNIKPMGGDAAIDSTGTLTLAASGVSAATYGSAFGIPILTVDAKGRVTAASTSPLLNIFTGAGANNYVARFSGTNSLTTGTIYDDGTNVGIGTTNPNARLTVYPQTLEGVDAKFGNPIDHVITFENGTIYDKYNDTGAKRWEIASKWIGTDTISGLFSGAQTLGAVIGNLQNSSELRFYTSNSTDYIQRMVINGSGYVGIGTTAPNRILEISSNPVGSSNGLRLSWNGNPTGYYGEWVALYNGPGLGFNYNFNIKDTVSSYDGTIMTLAHNGNVGIGTTSPDTKLHLVGGDTYVAPNSGYNFSNASGNEDLYVFGNLEVDGSIFGTTASIGQINIAGDVLLDLTGNGLAVSSNTLTIDATTAGTTSTTASNSGLEIGADGLRMIGGCAANNVLSWNSTLQTWGCSSLTGVGAVTGSGSIGQVSFWDGTSSLSGTNSFFWDNVGGKLGLGTTAPTSTLTITSADAAALQINPYGTSSGNMGELRFLELVANGSNYTGFKSPDSLDQDVIYTLPNSTAPSDYVLTYQNGSVLQWKQVSGIGGAGDITAVGSIISGDAFSDVTSDDQWLGLGSAAGRIEFDDQATDEVNILDANVGIGTSSPGAKLDVGGTVRAGGNIYMNSTGTGVFFNSTGSTFANGIWQSNDNVYIRSNDLDTLNVNHGNVGVGTTSPDAKLHVVNGDLYIAANSGYTFNNASSMSDIYTQGNLEIDGTTYLTTASVGQLNIAGDSISDLTGNGLSVSTGTLTIDATTTTTTSTTASNSGLEVSSDGLRILGGCSANQVLAWDAGANRWQCTDTATGSVNGTGVATRVAFWDGVSSLASSQSLYWDNSLGRLGIGTSAPAYMLDVNGDARVASGSDFYKDTIGLGSTGPTNITSGAFVIGSFDEFTYSTGSNVQTVLKDLDTQLGTNNTDITNLVGSSHPALSLNAGSTNYLSLDSGAQVLSVSAIDLSTVANTSGLLGALKGGTGIDGSSSPAGTLLIGTGSGFNIKPMGGDATIDSTGTLTLANSGVSAATYGSAFGIPILTVDAKGRVTAASTSPLLNILTGAGTTNYVSKFTASGTLANSLIFDDGTNVGIGTTSPQSKLDVRSLSGGSDTLGTGQLVLGLDNPYWTFRQSATSLSDLAIDRYFGGSYYESMRIQRSTGNVGIGTTKPTYKLEVNDDSAGGAGLKVTGGGSGAALATFTRDVGGNGTITIHSSADNPQIAFASPSNTFSLGTDGNYFKISDNTAIGTNDYLTITNNGKVGIGTTAPDAKLHLVGGDTYFAPNSGYTFSNASGDEDLYVFGNLEVDGSIFGTTASIGQINIAGDVLLDLTGNGLTTLSNTLTIDTTTTTTTSTTASNSGLEVASDGLRLIGGCSDSQVLTWDATLLTWKCATSAGGTVTGSGSLGQAAFWSGATTLSGSDSFFWDDSLSRLGIGTTVPSQALDVAGAIRLGAASNNNVLNTSTAGAAPSGNLFWGDRTLVDSSNVTTYATTGVTAGSGLTGGGTTGVLTLNIGAGSGVTINADDITIDTVTAGLSSTTASNSGLEVASDGLRMIGGCVSNEVLSWDATHQTWKCTAVSGANSLIGTGSPNQVAFWNSSTTLTGSDSLYWDSLTSRLGIGTTSPYTPLNVKGGGGNASFTVGTQNAVGKFTVGSSTSLDIGRYNADPYAWWLQARYDTSNNSVPLLLNPVGGNVGIGTTAPGALLHVSGGNILMDNNTMFQMKRQSDGAAVEILKSLATADTLQMKLPTSGAGTIGLNIINTGNTSLMAILGTGNVGIGTTSPTSRFQVQAASGLVDIARFVNNDYVHGSVGSGLRIGTGAATGNTYSEIQALDVGAASVADLILQPIAGNIGIGTTAPTEKLEVYGTSGALYAKVNSTAAGAAGLKLKNSTNEWLIYNDGTNEDAGYLKFFLGSDRVTFDSAGSVGIGTTTPTTALEVAGQFIQVTSNHSSGNMGLRLDNTGTSGDSWVLLSESDGTNEVAPAGSFAIRNEDTGVNPLVIDTAGNIGIGTTTPNSLLEIAGATVPTIILNDTNDTAAITSKLSFRGSGTEQGYVGYRWDGAPFISLWNSQTGSTTGLSLGTNNQERVRITNAGNVGIGTTSPGAKLDIRGVSNPPASSGTTSNASARIRGDGTGTLDIGSISGGNSYLQVTDTNNLALNYNLLLNPNGGNVGIGTTAPARVLNVKSSAAVVAQFDSLTGSSYMDLVPSGGTTARFGNTAGVLSLINGAGIIPHLAIDASGNVGIGTTSPGAILDIVGSIVRLNNSDTTSTMQFGGTRAQLGYAASGAGVNNLVLQGGASKGIIFAVNNATFGSGEVVRIDTSGNVGIGTTSPGALLDVNGNIKLSLAGADLIFPNGESITNDTDGRIIINSDNAGAGYLELGANVTSILRGGNIGINAYNVAADSSIVLQNSGAGYNANVSIDGILAVSGTGGSSIMGNVGIGTTSPVGKLNVVGSYTDAIDTDNSTIGLGSNGTSPVWGFQVGASTLYSLYLNRNTGGVDANIITFERAGNVGIGTTSPGSRLAIFSNTNIGPKTYSTTNGNGLLLDQYYDNSSPYLRYGDIVSSANDNSPSQLRFFTKSAIANPTANMVIDQNGNVGIGTTGPGSLTPLGWQGGTDSRILEVKTGGINGDSGLLLTRSDDLAGLYLWQDTSTGDVYMDNMRNNPVADIHFRTRTSGTPISAMTITGAGLVGIGTTAPTSMLSVGASSQFQVNSTGNIVLLNNVITSFPSVQGAANSFLRNDGAGTLSWADPTGTGVAGYWTRTGTTLFPTTNTDNVGTLGKMGVGTTSPLSTLDVLGNMVVGSGYAGTFTAPTNGLLVLGRTGLGTTAPLYQLDVAGITRAYDIITQELILAASNANILSAYAGFDAYTNFTGGIGTGGKDSIASAQRITSQGNLVNIGSIQAGELSLTSGGTFGAATTYPSLGNTPFGISVDDVNGDGKADLVAVNYTTNSIVVRLNDGTGTFSSGSTYPSLGAGPEGISVGDVNGDGKADLAAANIGTGSIVVRLNDGTGTFSSGSTYPSLGVNPSIISVGDVNGDGKADLAATNISTNSIGVRLNDGTGTFNSGSTYPSLGVGPYDVSVGDVNGDGKADLVAVNFNTSSIVVRLNDGTGTFSSGSTYPSLGVNPGNISVGDVNGDGKADIAFTNYGSDSVGVMLNTPSTMFDADAASGNLGIGITASSSKLSIAGGVIVGSSSYIFGRTAPSNGLQIEGLVGIGNASPSYNLDVAGIARAYNLITQELILAASNANILSAYAGFDGYTNFSGGIGTGGKDGLLATQRITSQGNLVNIGSIQAGETLLTSGGTMGAATTYPSNSVSPFQIAVGDLNGDGNADVAYTNSGSASLSIGVMLNNGDGTGTFGAATTYPAYGTTTQGISIKDLNGDGKADVIWTNVNSSSVGVMLNTGTGTFGAATTYPAGSGTTFVTAGDLNGDGKPDLSFTNSTSANSIGVMLNTGTGTFGAATTYPALGVSPRYITTEDINGDGKADAVFGFQSSTGFATMLNTGNGILASSTTYPGPLTYGLTTGDINGDGKADVAYTSNISNSVEVSLNNGSGTFGVATTYPTSGVAPGEIKLSDLNGDGKVDITFVNITSTSIGVMINNGTGTFGAATTYPTQGITPSGIATGDFNSDGKLDVVYTNKSTASNSIGVMLNQATTMLFAQASTGFVGIGTTAPSAGLTLGSTSDIYSNGRPTFSVSADGNFVLDFDTNADDVSSLFRITSDNKATELLRLNQSGMLGLGTTAPAYELDVAGVARVHAIITQELILAASNANILSAYAGFDGYTNFSGGIGTGSKDGLLATQRITSQGNLVNIGSIQAGETLLTSGGTMGAATTYPSTGINPLGVVAADFNGDGKADIAYTNNSPTKNSIGVMQNNGNGTFAAATTYPAKGTGPLGVNAADFNGDGKADIAYTNNSGGNSIGILLNSGTGTFSTATTYPALGTTPQFIATGDINGDGKADITYTNNGTNSIGTMINNGNGTFGTATTYPSAGSSTGPMSISTADINGDGKTDVIYTNFNSGNTIGVMLNAGSGTLAAATTYPSKGSGPFGLTVADVNNDGKTDFMYTNYSTDSIGVMLNSGAGVFGTATTYPSNGSNPVYITAGDLNGDGKPDLAYSNAFAGDSIGVMMNSGTGTFGAAATYPALGVTPQVIVNADFNGDGKPDLAYANSASSSNSIGVMLNTPSTMFDADAASGNLGIGITASSSKLSIAGGVIVGSSSYIFGRTAPSNGLQIEGLVGIGNASPSYNLDVAGVARVHAIITQELILGASGANILSAYTGYDTYTNFTGGIGTGGKDSLLSAQRITSAGNLVNIGSIQAGETLLTSAGTFGAATTYPSLGVDSTGTSLVDVNGDGKADLVAANQNTNSNSIMVRLNSGTGTFNSGSTYPSLGTGPRGMSAGDVNGDGKADLVAANFTTNSIVVRLNDGTGTFNSGSTYPSLGTSPFGVSVRDVNGDGKVDLVAANLGADSIMVRLNDGTGTFNSGSTYSSLGDEPYNMSVGDVNGDGKADLVATNNVTNSIMVRLNDGTGTFNSGSTYPSLGTNPRGISVGDVNGDGKADLVATNSATNSIMVRLNDGTGTFNSGSTYPSLGTNPYYVSMGDVNGDGKADLAATQFATNSIMVRLNSGTGTFISGRTYPSLGANPYHVSVEDVNGDGKADIAFTNFNGDSVGVMLNTATTMLYAKASTGFVGIGMATPSVALDVTGDIEYTGTIADVSDERLKENFAAISTPLDKILALNAYQFNMIGKSSTDIELGFKAQDIQRVLPELVSVVDLDKGYLGVNYIGLIPVITEAIKEQQTQIDELSNTQSDMYNDVNSIKELLGLSESSQSSQTAESSQSSNSQNMFISGLQFLISSATEEFNNMLSELGLSNEGGTLTVSSDLNVLGDSTLGNVIVTGDFLAGQFKLDSLENSLDINGPSCYNNDTQTKNTELCEAQTMYLQKGLAGNIDIFDGKIVIQPDGTLTIDGEIKATKVTADEYAVTQESQMTGEAVLGANSHFVTISNPNIKINSKVFVTPTTSTNGQSLIVSEKIEGTSFTVSMDNTFSQDIDFDWWILNVE